MTPEIINLVIEEWLGDSTYEETDCDVCGQEYRAVKHRDFWHDLNAVHEAVEALPSRDRPTFQYHLDKLNASSKDPHCSCWDFIQATAPQRCEALLRTLGRWEE